MLACPFCGAPETDRFELEGRRFVVFACMFTPAVEPGRSDEEVRAELERTYRAGGAGSYFRRTCDRLHLYVTQGEGGRVLKGEDRPALGGADAGAPTETDREGRPLPPRSRPASPGR